jgi:hypothetical protein
VQLNPWDFTSVVLFGKIPFSELALWPLCALGQLGGFGVAIFFVVSGFCTYQSYTQTTRPEAGVFFIRRFFRIYPPYRLTLLTFALVVPLLAFRRPYLGSRFQVIPYPLGLGPGLDLFGLAGRQGPRLPTRISTGDHYLSFGFIL